MAQKKEELPVNADVDLQNGGTITYANEVISTIAGVAANEIDGIAGMCISGGLSDIIGRNRSVTRGVKVDIGSEEASFDLYVIVEYGQPIQKVCHDVQENVRKAIESMTGLHVVRVDVHVQGVSFEKEKKVNQNMLEASKNPVLTEPEPEAAAETPEPPEAEIPPESAGPADNAEAAPLEEDAEFDGAVLTEEASLEADPKDAEQAAEEALMEPPAEEEPPKKNKHRKEAQPGDEKAPENPPKRPHGRMRS